MGLDSNCFIPDLAAMREANPRLVQAAAGAGIDALIRSGFGRKSEGLSVTLQTPAFHLLVQQLYTRGDNSIVFGELQTFDSREVPMVAAGAIQHLQQPPCHPRLNAANRRRTTTMATYAMPLLELQDEGQDLARRTVLH